MKNYAYIVFNGDVIDIDKKKLLIKVKNETKNKKIDVNNLENGRS